MATVTFNQVEHDKVLALPTGERWRRGLLALRDVLKDTNRTDQVLYAYEHLNAGTEEWRAGRFYRSETARRLYAQDKTLDETTVDFSALAKLPEDTLGGAYARFMRDNGLTPDIFHCEGGLTAQGYFIKRMRQTHDVWHAATGIGPDIPGELELQAFTLAQLWAPSMVILVLGGMVRSLFLHPTGIPRAIRGFFRGLFARTLTDVPWEELWERPLSEVRAQLRL